MRKILLFAVLLCSVSALAQMGGSPTPGPNNGMDELFSANPVYSATMQAVIASPNGPMTVTSKTYYDHGNSRQEMNMANVTGSGLPPAALTQAKAMGLDSIVTIAPASKTNIFTMYPNLRSYFSVPMPPSGTGTNDGIAQTTPLGNETVAGHPCVKNKVVVNQGGQSYTFTVWNATDLKNFPVQISVTQDGSTATITYQNISFGSIPASFFQPPSSYKSYDSIQSLMQAAIMSRMGSVPPPAPATPPTQ
jgi:outer membrane lipoprotein-sorting protein